MNNKEFPTEKQIKYATYLAKVLYIPLPTKDDDTLTKIWYEFAKKEGISLPTKDNPTYTKKWYSEFIAWAKPQVEEIEECHRQLSFALGSRWRDYMSPRPTPEFVAGASSETYDIGGMTVPPLIP